MALILWAEPLANLVIARESSEGILGITSGFASEGPVLDQIDAFKIILKLLKMHWTS